VISGDLAGMDEERIVDLSDDEPLLPESTRDDSIVRYDADAGRGERPRDSDEWLQDQRPPHWD
jgi:hypothetical protein